MLRDERERMMDSEALESESSTGMIKVIWNLLGWRLQSFLMNSEIAVWWLTMGTETTAMCVSLSMEIWLV
jgi:hypothetical protein